MIRCYYNIFKLDFILDKTKEKGLKNCNVIWEKNVNANLSYN